MEENELYCLISESEIEEINSKIVVLNRGIQLIKNDVSEHTSRVLSAYIAEIEVIINNTYKCNVIPQNKDSDR